MPWPILHWLGPGKGQKLDFGPPEGPLPPLAAGPGLFPKSWVDTGAAPPLGSPKLTPTKSES